MRLPAHRGTGQPRQGGRGPGHVVRGPQQAAAGPGIPSGRGADPAHHPQDEPDRYRHGLLRGVLPAAGRAGRAGKIRAPAVPARLGQAARERAAVLRAERAVAAAGALPAAVPGAAPGPVHGRPPGRRGGPGLRRIDPAARAAGRFHPDRAPAGIADAGAVRRAVYLQAHGHPRDADAARACDPELQPGGWRRLGRGIRTGLGRGGRPAPRPGQQQPDAARPAGRRPGHRRAALVPGQPGHRRWPPGARAAGPAGRARHVYAVYPTSRHLQPKVKAFVDFLAEHLPATLSGDS